MHIKSIYWTVLIFFVRKPYTLAGFESKSHVPLADAMTTVPRRRARDDLLRIKF
jgi:hypothetical protein